MDIKNNHSDSFHHDYSTIDLLFPKPKKIVITDGQIVISERIRIFFLYLTRES